MSPPRVRCPTCSREIEWSAEFPERPFCSDRCRLIDLGEWLAERRRIAGEEITDETASDEELASLRRDN